MCCSPWGHEELDITERLGGMPSLPFFFLNCSSESLNTVQV